MTLNALPLGIGGAILLLFARLLEGIPHIPLVGWGVVIGLAVVNTLVPYLLYSHALTTLHAIEANIFVSLTPLGTSLIAAITVDERLAGIQFAEGWIRPEEKVVLFNTGTGLKYPDTLRGAASKTDSNLPGS